MGSTEPQNINVGSSLDAVANYGTAYRLELIGAIPAPQPSPRGPSNWGRKSEEYNPP